MACLLCAWLCDRFCPPEVTYDGIWKAASDWEEEFAGHWEPEESEDTFRRIDILPLNEPREAFNHARELAKAGSVYAMLLVGWHLETGDGTAMNKVLAEGWYRRAAEKGSRKAVIFYSRLLFERGEHVEWRSQLQGGVDQGFIPAMFRMAWYSVRQAPSSGTYSRVLPLLIAASDAGHPGAKFYLARWMAQGKFGKRRIFEGFRKGISFVAGLHGNGADKPSPVRA